LKAAKRALQRQNSCPPLCTDTSQQHQETPITGSGLKAQGKSIMHPG